MSVFIRVPLASAVAALTLTGCTMPNNCATPAPAKPTQASAGGTATGGRTTSTKVVKTATVRPHRPGGRVRVAGGSGYRYSETGYAGGGRRYVVGGVSVTETETATSSYRYAEGEERYGSTGGYAYAAGAISGGGYASGSGYAAGGYATTGGPVYAAPPPTAGTPAYGRSYRLAGKDERGYLTWPGKVE